MLLPCESIRGQVSERVCDHGTAPLRTCELCVCQSKSREFQCELDPHHDGVHWYRGGLEDEFAITWEGCLHAFLGEGLMGVSCELERGHLGMHTGDTITDMDFEAAHPDDPKSREIKQTLTKRRVYWSADDATDPLAAEGQQAREARRCTHVFLGAGTSAARCSLEHGHAGDHTITLRAADATDPT